MDFGVKIFKVDESKVKAIASVSLDMQYAVNGFKLIEGSKGLFVAMPSVQKKDGSWKDVFFPVTAEARSELIDAILSAYDEV